MEPLPSQPTLKSYICRSIQAVLYMLASHPTKESHKAYHELLAAKVQFDLGHLSLEHASAHVQEILHRFRS